MFIGGQWVPAASGEVLEARNPATGVLLATVPKGGAADIDAAVAAARRAFEGPWSKFTPFERQALLLRIADRFEAEWENLCLSDTLRHGHAHFPYAGEQPARDRNAALLCRPGGRPAWRDDSKLLPRRDSVADRQGTDWRGRCHHSLECTDCRFRLEDCTRDRNRLHRGPEAIGRGVPNRPDDRTADDRGRSAGRRSERGDGNRSEAGAALAAHPGVDKIVFTGSTATGQAIARAATGNLKRVSLELGGKSPVIVCRDADIDKAVPVAAMAVFANSGQICIAGRACLWHARSMTNSPPCRGIRSSAQDRQWRTAGNRNRTDHF